MNQRFKLLALAAWAVLCAGPTLSPGQETASGVTALHVGDNGHFLVNAENRPVFILADTAWGLAIRLKREEITA